MYKNPLILSIFFIIITALFCPPANAVHSGVNGITQLEHKMSLNIINKLQAIADNDGITFSNDWPDEYFSDNNNYSFIYYADNGNKTLEMIKFDYSKGGKNCFTGENPDFCIPNVKPVINRFSYDNSFIAETIPDFAGNSNAVEKLEVLVKDGKFFDNRYITKLPETNDDENIYKTCSYDDTGTVTVCTTYSKTDDERLYTETLERRKNASGKDKIYKYIKISAGGNLSEEYFYENGTRIIYDSDGKIKTYFRVTEDNFKYYTSALPELYIDTKFTKDKSGNITEEKLYDRNCKLVRSYSAKYNEDNSIFEIKVNDCIMGQNWSIKPIGLYDEVKLPFKIRF